jgi:hypothetical protein
MWLQYFAEEEKFLVLGKERLLWSGRTGSSTDYTKEDAA